MKKILIAMITVLVIAFSFNNVGANDDRYIETTLKYRLFTETYAGVISGSSEEIQDMDLIVVEGYENKPNPIVSFVEYTHGEYVPANLLDLDANRFDYITDQEITNYDFIGWTNDENGTEAEYDCFDELIDDSTVYALYKRVNCTVNFFEDEDISEDGTILNTVTSLVGGVVAPPTAPVKYGYTFEDWSETLYPVYTDLDVYPIYSPKEYTINFYDYYNNLISSSVQDFNTVINYPIQEDIFGMVFTEWTKDPVYLRQNIDTYAQYEDIDIDTLELSKIVEINDNCFDDFGIANINFTKAIIVADYSVSQYGSCTLNVSLDDNKTYTIEKSKIDRIQDIVNLNLSFTYPNSKLTLSSNEIDLINGDLKVSDNMVVNDYSDFTDGNAKYTLTNNISSLSAYDDDVLLDHDYVYTETEVLDTVSSVKDIYYYGTEKLINDYNSESRELSVCELDDFHVLAYKTTVVDFNSTGDGTNENGVSIFDDIPVISDIQDVIVNAEIVEVAVVALASLVLLLAIALIIKKK